MYFRKPRVRRDGIEQFLRDTIRISVQKSHPQQTVGLRKFFQELG